MWKNGTCTEMGESWALAGQLPAQGCALSQDSRVDWWTPDIVWPLLTRVSTCLHASTMYRRKTSKNMLFTNEYNFKSSVWDFNVVWLCKHHTDTVSPRAGSCQAYEGQHLRNSQFHLPVIILTLKWSRKVTLELETVSPLSLAALEMAHLNPWAPVRWNLFGVS